MTRLKTIGPEPFWATALSRWNFRPLPSALPVIALMRSIQTAVGCLATVRIFAASVASPARVAALSTAAAYVGFTYCVAPAKGLSTCASAALALVVMHRGAASSAIAAAAVVAARRRCLTALLPCVDT